VLHLELETAEFEGINWWGVSILLGEVHHFIRWDRVPRPLSLIVRCKLKQENNKAKFSRDLLLLKYFYYFLALGMFWLSYEYSLLSQCQDTKYFYLGMLSKLCEITNTTTITIFIFLLGLWFIYYANSKFIKKWLVDRNT